METRLGRFDPSGVRGTPEFEARDVAEPMGARPDIGAAGVRALMERERGPSKAPSARPKRREK